MYSYKRRYLGPLKAVILDWAGTTVDFGSVAPVTAVMKSFHALDVPVTLEQARGPMGMAKRAHIQAMLDMPEVSSRWQSVHGNAPREDDVDKVYQAFLPLMGQVVAEHAELIRGCNESIDYCRSRGMKIGSSTGYTRELMDVLEPLAAEQGYRPDAVLCAGDTPAGRPAPWMCYENAKRLGVYPCDAVVKVDDTVVGIEAGLNAGMWTIGVSRAGNLVGLPQDQLESLPQEEQARLISEAADRMHSAGAHLVIESIADLPQALAQIEQEMKRLP